MAPDFVESDSFSVLVGANYECRVVGGINAHEATKHSFKHHPYSVIALNDAPLIAGPSLGALCWAVVDLGARLLVPCQSTHRNLCSSNAKSILKLFHAGWRRLVGDRSRRFCLRFSYQ